MHDDDIDYHVAQLCARYWAKKVAFAVKLIAAPIADDLKAPRDARRSCRELMPLDLWNVPTLRVAVRDYLLPATTFGDERAVWQAVGAILAARYPDAPPVPASWARTATRAYA